MSEDNGFILKAEMYNQEEWYRMYLNMLKVCKKLQQENKSLKEVTDKLKTNIENDIDGFRTINEFRESQALKKKLEETQSNYEKEKYIVDKQTRQLADEYKNTEYQTNKVKELKNQQKEFIEYLENEIEKTCNSKNMSKCNLYQEILSKYKEIIGGDN